MEIGFSSRRVEKLCTSAKEMRSKLGDRTAKLLQQRLSEMKAAVNLDDLSTLPGARCHELKGDRQGQLAVDLGHPKRLVFEVADDPRPRKPDGGLDWTRVTQVAVLEIVDYH